MTTKTNKLWVLAALAAPLAGCGGFLYAEIEQPEVCKLLPEQTFSGSEHSRRLEINLAEQLPGLDIESPDGLKSVFHITRVEFIARSGISNFDFLDSAKITLLPPEGTTLESADVIDYTREGTTTETLTMHGASNVDLYQYLAGGAVTVDATLAGTLPSNDWSIEIKTCVYAKVRANYLELGDSLANGPSEEPAPTE